MQKDTDLNGGDLVIGNDKPLAEENKAQAELKTDKADRYEYLCQKK